ncbi:hypothetical protein F4777DRAFT_586833 [Nemania sp. FL0916]|nr:hypothetical protein F4777DRAFT_586833 [Nemania sp. FL0916]
MKSLAKYNLNPIHNWTAPAHYYNCSVCLMRHNQEVQEELAKVRGAAELVAAEVAEDQGSHHRVIAISPRLIRPRIINGILRQESQDPYAMVGSRGLPRRVTIRIPNLPDAVRPDQSPQLHQRRPAVVDDQPDVPQFFVPQQPIQHFGLVQPLAFQQLRPHLDHQAPQLLPRTSDENNDAAAAAAAAPAADRTTTTTPTIPSSELSIDSLSMPGAWPSWADGPDGVDGQQADAPPVAPRVNMQHVEPANVLVIPPPNPPANARFGLLALFGDFSSQVLNALRTAVWRPVQAALPAQQQLPLAPPAQRQADQPAQLVPVSQLERTAQPVPPPTIADIISRVSKRPRLGDRPILQGSFPSFPPRRHVRPRKRDPCHQYQLDQEDLRSRSETDLNFNYRGHFSADALDASDSEDGHHDETAMDIEQPQPTISHMSDFAFARQRVEPEHTAPELNSDEHVPVALDGARATLGRQSINLPDSSPAIRLDPATAAARRAIRQFPNNSMLSRTRVEPSTDKIGSDQAPYEAPTSTTHPTERLRNKDTVLSSSANVRVSPKSEKGRYDDVLDFFPNDIKHSLPGLEDECLPADARKIEHLNWELMERMRQEEIESQNAAFRHLGVRKPKSVLIRELPSEWANRAENAPQNGRFKPDGVHADAVELNPRDFAKLVPPTAWLNDDCVHSSLCCLAAYVNKRANVKPKADPPKCVAVSSLYWQAFCGDHKKLYPRPFSRKWNMTPKNFLDIDTVLIPVNSNSHWTLIVIRPSRRTVSYLDSFHSRGEIHLRYAYEWLKLFLGDEFVPDDWDTQEFTSPRQTNAWDCGVFVITNAMCLALGLSPMFYNEDMMPVQRKRIAAMLLNGGFHGEFDLGQL